MQQRLDREQSQNRQSSQPDLLVAERGPRQHSQQNVNGERDGQAIQISNWCTGEDSNLRSSQGAADLQSAAINHSATCAENAESAGPSMLACPAASPGLACTHGPFRAGGVAHETHLRDAREHTSARSLKHVGNSLMECVPGNPAVLLPARLCKRPAFRKPFSGAGEGIRTPDPLITNQMLYQLSYASKTGLSPFEGAKRPP
jgi:hypothetical protein